MLDMTRSETRLADLAGRYRTAFDKTKAGREQWIEGTLELAAVIWESRITLPDHRAFGEWIKQNGLQPVSKDDRTALMWMREDPEATRKLLLEANSFSWRGIYQKHRKCTPLRLERGTQRHVRGHLSGSAKRKRAARIPDVMREDNPEPGPARKPVILRALTREQVDPDFVGDSIEFATKYGHVTLHTKDEIEHNKRQEALSVWLSAMTDLDRTSRLMLATLEAVSPEALHEWKMKPGKAIKLRSWLNNIELACKKLGEL